MATSQDDGNLGNCEEEPRESNCIMESGEDTEDSAIATKDDIMIVEEGASESAEELSNEINGNGNGVSSIEEEERMVEDDEDTAVSMTPTLNTNNNTENCNQQRLNLDILSTISNQSEIDAQEHDGDQQMGDHPDREEANDADNEEEFDEDNNTLLSQGSVGIASAHKQTAACQNRQILPPPDVTPALEKTTKSVAVNTVIKPNTSQSTSPTPTPSASRQQSRNSSGDFPSSSSNSIFSVDLIESSTKDVANELTASSNNNNGTSNEIAKADAISAEAFVDAVSSVLEHQPLQPWEHEELLNDMGADSEEEICTCRDYTEDERNFSSEDELPSRDVDLSGYTASDPISEELLNDRITETPKNHRKRKINECRSASSDIHTSELGGMRTGKRVVLENRFSPRAIFTPSASTCSVVTTTPTSSGSFYGEKKTPRSVIPTKDNPPPELSEWLIQFQKWSNAERLLAVDRLIEYCEPTQVRHMMKVIEPQFQRDFISLLPRELALQVLSYLGPKDLLRAAQTCRSWRYLADDNLMWKAKCKEVGILDEIKTDERPLRRARVGNMPHMSSIWKTCYMRHYTIEMNWRSRPIRTPKVLKGHDDHVITCLQFCGNRIVSGSDDNTLKVWSAVTGRCLRTLVGHTGGVWSSQMSNNIIISGSTDRTLKVWDANSGECLHTLYGHTSTVRCMHLHGNK